MRKESFLGKDLEKGDFSKKIEESPSAQKMDARLVLLDSDFSGRDEMNLAGNPFALLQSASKNGQTYIKYEWDKTLPNGKAVKATWEVNGHNDLGLPGPTDELLYLVLLQVTREAADEQGNWPQKIYFSRYDLLKRLDWPDNNNSYKALRQCFTRLSSVNITANHAFWDARTKAPFASINFGLLNESAIVDEPRGRKGQGAMPLSWFEWNSILHSSLQAGNVRNLALDFTLSLELPTSRRLFRLLDLFRHAQKPARREFTIGLMKLRDRLGMTNYKHASKIKEKLLKAHSELIERGYLASVEYQKGKDGSEMAIYRFADARALPSAPEANEVKGEAPAAQEKPVAQEESNILRSAHQWHAVYMALPDEKRAQLLEEARTTVPSIFWDRLENPDSPMSLRLWELVAQNH